MANTETYYSREVEMPRTKRDGLANFIQIIVNRLEAGETQEAMLQAVDLLNDINTGAYDDAMVDHKAAVAASREMEDAHRTALQEEHADGVIKGMREERKRIARVLGFDLETFEAA